MLAKLAQCSLKSMSQRIDIGWPCGRRLVPHIHQHRCLASPTMTTLSRYTQSIYRFSTYGRDCGDAPRPTVSQNPQHQHEIRDKLHCTPSKSVLAPFAVRQRCIHEVAAEFAWQGEKVSSYPCMALSSTPVLQCNVEMTWVRQRALPPFAGWTLPSGTSM